MISSKFDAEINELVDSINAAYASLVEVDTRQREQRNQLNDLASRMASLAASLDVDLDLTERDVPTDSLSQRLSPAVAALPPKRQKELKNLYQRSETFPSFSETDYFVMATVALLAVVADIVLVGLPQDGWIISNAKNRVPIGVLSDFIKRVDVDRHRVLEKLCKVPYDISTAPGLNTGLYPVNHRFLSLGHDPSPLGLLAGLIDIASGGTSIIDKHGVLRHIPTYIPEASTLTSVPPVLWLGHLISDVSTPMGLPAPGAVWTQLLHVPIPGVAGSEQFIPRLTERMYVAGYDFRQYMMGGVVPGLVEALIHLYVWLDGADSVDDLDMNYWKDDSKVRSSQMKQKKLASMLFWTHALAAAGNAGKIALAASTPGANFFTGMLAFNRMEWEVFMLRTVEFILQSQSSTTVEQISANRRRLNQALSEHTDLYEFNWDSFAQTEVVA
jgi:hypothetical protein